jgi:hypothetical protein
MPVSTRTPTADESAVILRNKLESHEPFFYLRFGDGFLECVHGLGYCGYTCDGERYSRALGAALLDAWNTVTASDRALVGDWQSATFNGQRSGAYEREWDALVGGRDLNFVHFEALLLRESVEVVEFYRAVKNDPRRKVYLGPESHADGAHMLGARHVVTPMESLFESVDSIKAELLKTDFEVLLYGAGMAGAVAAASCFRWYPDRTYIHIGSALDPLYRGRTRSNQLPRKAARRLMKGIL